MKQQKGSGILELIFTLVLVAVIMFGSWLVKEYKCSNYEDMTGMQTKYKIFDGCYVKTDQGWFLREQLRDIQASNTQVKEKQ